MREARFESDDHPAIPLSQCPLGELQYIAGGGILHAKECPDDPGDNGLDLSNSTDIFRRIAAVYLRERTQF